MRLVVGDSLTKINEAAIDAGLSLKGPLERRDSAIGLWIPEYVASSYQLGSSFLTWCWRLPDDAYELLKDGRRICTAEFSFLLLARILSVEELALFGLELCGTYVIDKSDKRGFVCNTVPQTNVDRLRCFLDACAGAPGIVRAKQALRWVADNSASPMESLLVLMLCLPRRLGGFGLPMPELNVSVNKLRGFGNVLEGPFVDLIWRWASFSLEYDSDLEHTGADRISRDSIRRIRLEELGIRSFSVTNEQVNSTEELSRVARVTSVALGRKFHATNLEMRRRNAALRQQLIEFTRYEVAPSHDS